MEIKTLQDLFQVILAIFVVLFCSIILLCSPQGSFPFILFVFKTIFHDGKTHTHIIPLPASYAMRICQNNFSVQIQSFSLIDCSHLFGFCNEKLCIFQKHLLLTRNQVFRLKRSKSLRVPTHFSEILHIRSAQKYIEKVLRNLYSELVDLRKQNKSRHRFLGIAMYNT